MKKYAFKSERPKKPGPKEWPVVVYLWMIGLGVAGYLMGRIALYTAPHPYHWLSMLTGALLGIVVGWFWYQWRGYTQGRKIRS
jgi:hypothetical protein